MKQPLCSACAVTVSRFKEHIQNNLPRDFLTTEQFVQLRRELAAASGHSGEDGDELPCGTEDITDPAKVLQPSLGLCPGIRNLLRLSAPSLVC